MEVARKVVGMSVLRLAPRSPSLRRAAKGHNNALARQHAGSLARRPTRADGRQLRGVAWQGAAWPARALIQTSPPPVCLALGVNFSVVVLGLGRHVWCEVA